MSEGTQWAGDDDAKFGRHSHTRNLRLVTSQYCFGCHVLTALWQT